MRQGAKGLYTYDRVPLSNAHAVAQFIERLYVLLSAFAHGNILHNEAFVPPCLHSLDVELLVFRRDVQHGRAAAERQPAIAVGKKLLRHIVNVFVVVCECSRDWRRDVCVRNS